MLECNQNNKWLTNEYFYFLIKRKLFLFKTFQYKEQLIFTKYNFGYFQKLITYTLMTNANFFFRIRN